MSKMNPEIKARWVAALCSGEYKQASKALRGEDAFCCLGVLCDIHAKETGSQWDEDGRYFRERGVPPEEVTKWASLPAPNPNVTIDGKTFALAEFNDGFTDMDDGTPVGAKSFAEIAEAIEKQL